MCAHYVMFFSIYVLCRTQCPHHIKQKNSRVHIYSSTPFGHGIRLVTTTICATFLQNIQKFGANIKNVKTKALELTRARLELIQ